MNAVLAPKAPTRESIYRLLRLRCGTLSPNGEWLSRMLASWCVGDGALPDHLGLGPEQFTAMMGYFFGDLAISGEAVSGRKTDFSRMLEREDLTNFLMRHSAGPDPNETAWISGILVAGCLGEDHLWHDVGLWSRRDLSHLIIFNFPGIAALNTRDMKWKKFIYKQLCEAEGIYICRAPSCEVCADYRHCFEPEED